MVENKDKKNCCPGFSLLNWLLPVFLLMSCLFAVPELHCAQITLSWTPNHESDLAGYRVFARRSGEEYDYNQPAWEGWIEADELWKNPVDLQAPTCTIVVEDATVTCFVLRAFDTSGNESTDSNEACWEPPPAPNVPPVALAGADQTAQEGSLAALDGSHSYDPDGVTLLYRWSQISGQTVVLSDDDTATPWFTAPPVSLGEVETLVFELEVTDEGGSKDTDQVTITVMDDGVEPIGLVINGPDSVDENNTASYTATALFSDGSSESVTNGCAWSENASYASITNTGVLIPSDVPSDRTVTIKATYTLGSVEKTAQKTVTIQDVPPSPNSPPDPPDIVGPNLGPDVPVSLTPELTLGEFSDPDNGDTHLRTLWQISLSEHDFSEAFLVFEADSESHLNALVLPRLVLDAQTGYFWRARFYDNHNAGSDWSVTGTFVTLTTDDDDNHNGIPDNQEVDSSVDLDGNGIADTGQNDIKSVNTVVGDAQMGIKTGPGVLAVDLVRSIDLAELPSADNAPDETPFGMLGFRLSLEPSSDAAQVTLYLSDPAPDGSAWYKFDSVNGWQTDALKVVSAISNDRQSVTLYLEDGGYWDADGVVNGVIVDPGGIGFSYAPGGNHNSPDTQNSQSGGGGGGGGGGCFISMIISEGF